MIRVFCCLSVCFVVMAVLATAPKLLVDFSVLDAIASAERAVDGGLVLVSAAARLSPAATNTAR